MLGRFDREQRTTADRRKIIAAGPIEWEPGDEGRKITRLDVEFAPESGPNCNGRSPDGVTFDQGVHTRWEFEMPNNGMALGPVKAIGKARLDDGQRTEWVVEVDDPDSVSIVAP
jgi:hypothetical protein